MNSFRTLALTTCFALALTACGGGENSLTLPNITEPTVPPASDAAAPPVAVAEPNPVAGIDSPDNSGEPATPAAEAAEAAIREARAQQAEAQARQTAAQAAVQAAAAREAAAREAAAVAREAAAREAAAQAAARQAAARQAAADAAARIEAARQAAAAASGDAAAEAAEVAAAEAAAAEAAAAEAAAAEAAAAEAAAARATASVTVFTECGFEGDSAELPIGDTNVGALGELGIDNNVISSIRVPDGFNVLLFNSFRFTGEPLELDADASCLDVYDFDNLVSAITISADSPAAPVDRPVVVTPPVVTPPVVDDPPVVVDPPVAEPPVVVAPPVVVPPPVAVPPVVIPPVVDDTAAIASGKASYEATCVGCHGSAEDIKGTVLPARGAFPAVDIAAETFTDTESGETLPWVEYNAKYMPFGRPGACDADCAENILTYLQTLATDIEPASPGSFEQAKICVPETAVRRSKNLLTGLPPTPQETAAVQDDPEALRDLVTEWIETEEFRAKMLPFFSKALQQTSAVQDDYAVQMLGDDLADRWRMHEPFMLSMRESMARTALWIIDNDRPFNEIASGRTWMMTTQMMAYLAALETSGQRENLRFYHENTRFNNINFNPNTPMNVQIANKMFYTPQPLQWQGNGFDCNSDPVVFNDSRRDRLFAAFMTPGGNQLVCRFDIKPNTYRLADASDWRPVTMVRGNPDVWWDAPAFRGKNRLTLRTSRTGFFSHPAFFASWRSNEDNDFRVTTNQSLIVGLGRAFEETDTSIPLGDEGLADDHAGPGTPCFACHKTLDPMRTFFDVDFNADRYGAHPNQQKPGFDPSFSFLGHSGTGKDLVDFGRHIAEHPLFATGWVLKMCAFANADHCDQNNPEFQRIVTAFEDSNFNFKTMMIELFSSTLVTNSACADSNGEQAIPISLTRQDHFCPTLAARTGIDNICSINATRILANALPADSWSRGSNVADQATDPGLFYRATVDALCSAVSTALANETGSPLQASDIDGSLDWLVNSFMGISRRDSRFASIRSILEAHYDDVSNLNANNRQRLISAATLACISPFITSTDF